MNLPAFTADDRLPDSRAVWRDYPAQHPKCPGFRHVSLELLDGSIERTTVERADWSFVARWRFGWPPA